MASDPRVQAFILVVGVWGGVIIPAVFAAYYTCIARWWENSLGRTIIALDLCILTLRVTRLDELWHYGARALGPADWVATLAMLAMPGIIGWRLAAFERKRRRMKREAKKTAEVLKLVLTGLVP